MKENGPTITLDKSEYRKIPDPEPTRKPEANPFNKKEEEMINTIRLTYTRRQLAESPMLALIMPIYELPEKPHDFAPRNDFLDIIMAIFRFIANVGRALFSKDKG
jgi:hypothetical protein